LVNTRYKEIGIATAYSGSSSYVLVFGNPGGPDFAPAGGGSNSSAGNQQPDYVVGLDEHGNIKHQIQDGDTLGQIALIYGYTWGDIPGILGLNGLTEADYRGLEVGSIILVPPKAGTYTPTPGNEAATTPPDVPTQPVGDASPTGVFTPTAEPVTSTPTPLAPAIATAVPEVMTVLLPTALPALVANVATPAADTQNTPSEAEVSITSSNLLTIALVVQVGVLLLAGLEFIRRTRRRATRPDPTE
jgi:hypothetical protein